MPTLRFHAVETADLLPVSEKMLHELMDIYQVPADYINIEIVRSEFIVEGKVRAGFPMVEVCAFKRGDEVQDAVARCVCEYLKKAGYPESELYFSYPEPRSYYGNGEHY
ncbi:MAG: DUF1904 family protein [Bacteroidales bacterium]